jgi:hypothetical protein
MRYHHCKSGELLGWASFRDELTPTATGGEPALSLSVLILIMVSHQVCTISKVALNKPFTILKEDSGSPYR